MIYYKPSTSHWIFPPIIIGILIFLLVIMGIQRFVRCKKTHTPFLNFRAFHFFENNYDKLKFYGTFILFFLYLMLMNVLHFVFASILFVFLFNVLYCGVGTIKIFFADIKSGGIKHSRAAKSLLISFVSSVVFSVAIWFVFGVIFKTTLP